MGDMCKCKIQNTKSSFLKLFLEILILSNTYNQGKSRGGSNGDGRLLIRFYYSAVTGNRKQVLTGRSESCEHKCR